MVGLNYLHTKLNWLQARQQSDIKRDFLCLKTDRSQKYFNAFKFVIALPTSCFGFTPINLSFKTVALMFNSDFISVQGQCGTVVGAVASQQAGH